MKIYHTWPRSLMSTPSQDSIEVVDLADYNQAVKEIQCLRSVISELDYDSGLCTCYTQWIVAEELRKMREST